MLLPLNRSLGLHLGLKEKVKDSGPFDKTIELERVEPQYLFIIEERVVLPAAIREYYGR